MADQSGQGTSPVAIDAEWVSAADLFLFAAIQTVWPEDVKVTLVHRARACLRGGEDALQEARDARVQQARSVLVCVEQTKHDPPRFPTKWDHDQCPHHWHDSRCCICGTEEAATASGRTTSRKRCSEHQPDGDPDCPRCGPYAVSVRCFCGQPDDRDRVHRAHACEPWVSRGYE